jgi:uncharacterized protein DUF3237
VKLVRLYRVRFEYPRGWEIALAGPGSPESQHFYLAEGSCEGRIRGALVGANHPRRRGDRTFEPDFQGIIETEDGAKIFFEYRGYGRAYPEGRRQIVASATHLSDDPRYAWLNDGLAVGTGEVRSREGAGVELVIDWSEIVWEPIPDADPGSSTREPGGR